MTDTAQRPTRRIENLAYAVIWLIVLALYVLGSVRRRTHFGESMWDVGMLQGMVRTVLPLVVLFAVNNWLLMPRLLLRGRWKAYAVALLVALALLLWYQYADFTALKAEMHHGGGARGPRGPRSLLPLPVLLDFTCGLLVVGANLAIALLCRRYDDQLERQRLLKANAESQLTFLKAQINPHFYLNMLNNIHGMIDIDTGKAQTMLVEMSKLMRFMLYDSSKDRVPLSEEVAFLENYLRLMQVRYPEHKLELTWRFPSPRETGAVEVPPLLFLAFIENAFKHGVSYRSRSYVHVDMALDSGQLHFVCVNSVAGSNTGGGSGEPGIGLRNVRERLKLLYGASARLNIEAVADKYTVALTIPVHDYAQNSAR